MVTKMSVLPRLIAASTTIAIVSLLALPVASETVVKSVKGKQSPRDVIVSGFRGLEREKWTNEKTYGMQIVKDPPGGGYSKAVRMELRYGDCGQVKDWDDCKQRNQRVELTKENAFKAGQTKKYAWSMYFPKSFSTAGSEQIVVTQFSMMGGKYHPFQFYVKNGGLMARKRVESADWNYESLVKTIVPSSHLRGRWHRIEVDAKWSLKSDGIFQVRVDGKLVYDWKGATLSEPKPGKIKLGMYRIKLNSKAPPVVAYFAGLVEK